MSEHAGGTGRIVEGVLPGESAAARAAHASLEGEQRGLGAPPAPILGPAFVAAVASARSLPRARSAPRVRVLEARPNYNGPMRNASQTDSARTPVRGGTEGAERAKRASSAMPDEQDVRAASELLKAVGDPTRLRLLCALLLGEELSVGELQRALDMSQSAVSHQLRVLRDARLVTHRREWKLAYYSLADEHVLDFLRVVLEHVRHD